MEIDHVYVLNLERAKERKEHSKKILEEQGLEEGKDFTILKGVDGENIPKEEAKRINKIRMKYYDKNNINTRPLTRGQLGCVMSHMLAYENMIEKNQKLCLILEDDSKFIKPYSEIIETLQRFPCGYNFDYMLLHRKCPNLCLKAKTWPFVKNWFKTYNNDAPLGSSTEFVKAGLSYGTNSQLVTLKGAKKMLDWCQTIYDPMDIQIHLLNSHTNIFNPEKHESLKMYSTVEPLMQPCGFTSLTQRIR